MNYSLKTVRTLMIGVIGTLAVLYGVSFAINIWSGGYEFTSKFERIEIGAPITEAISILGEPIEITNVFRLGQRHGYEEAYERAEQSSATNYYIWSCCIDKTYTLGVNSDGNVVVAEYGGT